MLCPIISHIAAFLVSAFMASVLMRGVLTIYRRHRDSNHSSPTGKRRTPAIGGMVLLPAMAVGGAATLLLDLLGGTIAETLRTSSFIIAVALLLIYVLGILGDLLDARRWQRNAIFVLASVALPIIGLYLNNMHGLFGLHYVSYPVGFVATFLFSLLIVKCIEELSALEGLSAAIGLVVLLTFGGIYASMGQRIYAITAFATAGAVAVFLRYSLFGDEKLGNKVSLGYTGVLVMGFCIVYLALKHAMDNRLVIDRHAVPMLLPYSLFALPIFDYLRVLVIGMWQGLTREERQSRYLQSVLLSKGFSSVQTVGLFLFYIGVAVGINLVMHYLLYQNITWIVFVDLIAYVALLNVLSKRVEAPQVKPLALPTDFRDYRGQDGMVSIVMSTYNSAAFVAESIESILAQTYEHWELIITDDHSSDGTMKILEQYAARDARIVVQCNDTNRGAGVTRNRSIAKAQGQYIAFCDSDDRWLPKKLELQVSFMRSMDVALCFAPYYSCDENNIYLGYISAPRRVSLFSTMCDNKIGFLTCIYDTHVLGKHLLPQQRKRQDHALLLTLLRQCQYAYSMPRPVAFYRIHEGTLSSKKISLLKYNAQTYTVVFGWSTVASYLFLFLFFLPSYFAKRVKNIVINAVRAA